MLNYTYSDTRRDEVNDLLQITRLSWTSMRRHRSLIIAATLIALGLATAYVLLRPDAYTASSRILVDNRVLSLQQQDAVYSVSSLTSQLMDSQVEILRSDNISRSVIDELKLLQVPDFGGDSFVPRPTADGAPAAPAEGDPRGALKIFQKHLAVDRVGQSYVIEIRMTASDPKLAADVTNSLVSNYLKDQDTANASAAQSASGWLRSRLQSLGTTARVLTPATAPLERDGPRGLIILFFAAFCGLIIGTSLALIRDVFDRRLRSRDAVENAAHAECFGALPDIGNSRARFWRGWRKKGQFSASGKTNGLVQKAETLDWVIERPRSAFAHTLKRARGAVFEGRTSVPKIVGITSMLPGEGKTTVAANLARLAADWGKKVLLIDAVPYNSRLTKLFAPNAEFGLNDALRGASLADIVLADRWTDMHFLPWAASSPHMDAPLVSSATERFLAQVKTNYDLVVIDLPPLTPVSDVHELAHLLDKILLVVEWGRYSDEELAHVLAHSKAVRAKLVGTVLNKADTRQRYADPADSAKSAAFPTFVDDRERHPAEPAAARLPQEEKPRPAIAAKDAASVHLRTIQKGRTDHATFDGEAKTNA